MKKKSLKTYLVIFGTLFFLFSLSLGTSSAIRGKMVGLLSFFEGDSQELSERQEIENLRLQINRLNSENAILKEKVLYDVSYSLPTSELTLSRVIFRTLANWDQFLWVNVGSQRNEELGRVVIDKNSPVVSGENVVGVIDYVEKRRSRVRLITDVTLVPSVRVARTVANERLYLAKGELSGSSQVLWRGYSKILKGSGFNYDFRDPKGGPRDLRTGRLMNQKGGEALPLIKVGDLLVTTGMDGVFPPDLKVATVTKILPLKEGDFAYEIEALPTAQDLDELKILFILPPVNN